MYASILHFKLHVNARASKENKFRNLGIFNSNLCKEIAAKM